MESGGREPTLWTVRLLPAPVCGEETQDDVRVSCFGDQEQLRRSLQVNLDGGGQSLMLGRGRWAQKPVRRRPLVEYTVKPGSSEHLRFTQADVLLGSAG